MFCGWGVKAGMVYLQVKLCDPCLSAFEALCVKMRYTNRRILYFTLLCNKLEKLRSQTSCTESELKRVLSRCWTVSMCIRPRWFCLCEIEILVDFKYILDVWFWFWCEISIKIALPTAAARRPIRGLAVVLGPTGGEPRTPSPSAARWIDRENLLCIQFVNAMHCNTL